MDRDLVLRRLKSALPDLQARYGVARLGVFGSVARGEARPGSDVDLVVEFTPGAAPGLGFFELERELAELLEASVEIAALDRMNAVVRAAVVSDLVYV